MKVTNFSQKRSLWFGLIDSLALIILVLGRQIYMQHRQSEVALRGSQVMPFDLEKTTHIFEPLADGGLQTVVANNPADEAQIELIQTHLQAETAKFQTGDFSDPAAIHGDAMPGLDRLRTGYWDINIQYTALPDGAQIRYTARTADLTTAIHDWFAAQRLDHGHHAM